MSWLTDRGNIGTRTWCMAGVLMTVLVGCSNMSSDIDDLRESIMPPSPTEAAVMMIDPYDAENRRNGTILIANAPFGGAEPYVNLYADKVLHEDDPLALAAAIQALGRHGQPEHAPSIASRLTHVSQQVRWEAAKGLQRLHNPQVVPALIAVIRNAREDVDVKIAAAHALGQYPEDRVFQTLVSVDALDAQNLILNRTARESLRTLTGQNFGEDRAAWLRWYNAAAEPFVDQQPYLFPIYKRSETVMEKLTFWSEPTWETPQQPAGLRPAGQRSTYDEGEDGAAEDSGG